MKTKLDENLKTHMFTLLIHIEMQLINLKIMK